jgi:hypothetical protein
MRKRFLVIDAGDNLICSFEASGPSFFIVGARAGRLVLKRLPA